MCYRIELKSGIEAIANRFKARIDNPESSIFDEEINGFAFKKHPIITNDDPQTIATDFSWGLIPHWCKDDAIRKNTLNAKIETLDEKPAFRDVVHNRCLIIATGYYEWRWNDEKGKSKQKFEIHSAEHEIFSLAGIYSSWTNPATRDIVKSFAVVTTDANQKMQYIHNNKKRMPVMLKQQDEMNWLNGKPQNTFGYPVYDADLIAFTIS